MSVEMSQERQAQVSMLIRFFNMQAGSSCRADGAKNTKIVNDCIERNRQDIVAIKNYVRNYCNEHKDAKLEDCFDLCNLFAEEKKEEPPVVQSKQEVVPEKPEFAMAVLEKVIMQTIAQTQVDKISEQMKDKEKQIEEIENIIRERLFIGDFEPLIKRLAVDIVEKNNYRKLSKDSVVLSREEYKRLKSLPNKIIKYMDRHLGNGELCGNVVRNCAKQFGVEIKE